jgi:hypothetical protein
VLSSMCEGSLLRALLLSDATSPKSGVCRKSARRLASDCPENWDDLRRELLAVHRRVTSLVFEITALQNEAQVFSERFCPQLLRSDAHGRHPCRVIAR